jgi:hypothetical protein
MATYISLCPIIIGAGMTTVGEYHYSALGLFITIFGVILAAVKVCIGPSALGWETMTDLFDRL